MKKADFTAATIGVFDGVHLGHCFLLNKVREVAETRGMSPLAVTFSPTPAEVFNGQQAMLLTLDERRERLLGTGMDKVAVLAFDREMAAMTTAQFMALLKEQYGVRVLVMGYDHRFGCEQRRDAAFYDATAATLGIEIVHAAAYGDVSSTRIREALMKGDVVAAERMLGYPFQLQGSVVAGDGRGRTLGFPTANLTVAPEKLIPATGVYAVSVNLKAYSSPFMGMMNIGLCPTFGGRTKRRIEVHILDFDADIYGQTLTARLLHHVRDERRFPSVEDLIHQLQNDACQIRQLLENN